MDANEVKKRVGDGWIKSWMMIEVLAINEEVAKSSLEELADRLAEQKGVEILAKDFKEARKVEKPLPNIPEAFSRVLELEILTKNFETLVTVVINFGPSAFEILEPQSLKINLSEAHSILTQIADVIHRFASTGIGGLVFADVGRKAR